MSEWLVLTHNPSVHQSLRSRVEELGLEAYSPTKVKLYKRSDRPSCWRREEPLFPGYLFVNADLIPDQVHPSEVSALNGAHGFVRFGTGADQWGRVKGEIVDALRAELQSGLVLRTDPSITCADYLNLPPGMEVSLRLIVEMRSEKARKAAFFKLLQQSALMDRLASRGNPRVYTALHPF